MKVNCFFLFLSIALILTGCSPSLEKELEDTWEASGYVTVGGILTVQKADSPFRLLDNMDVLTADGLYYAAWTMGDAEPYENSAGKTVDLYDAQLYLLLGEASDEAEAVRNMNNWLDAARTNYEVLDEEEITCNGQSYSLITYNCISEDNPYARGVSAFGVHHESAVCIELTCREDFDKDIRTMLTDFLDHCAYSEE